VTNAALRTERITKIFPGTVALDCVDFTAYAGCVNILVGENGAGKSTLMKILAGAEQPSSGKLYLNGIETTLGSPSEAAAKGIGIVYQELDLCPNMSVSDNIFLAHELNSWGVLDRAGQRAISRSLLNRLEHDIDPNRTVGELRVSSQQIVAIAKALRQDTKVLIMDEPTSALSETEVRTLFRLVSDLKNRGVAIIYISHRMDELLEIGDYITVLRDGRLQAHAEVRNIDMTWILERMLGHANFDIPAHDPARDAAPILVVDDLRLPKPAGGFTVDGVSLTVKAGEIVGIYGLMGAGRTELLESLMGLHPKAECSVWLDGQELGEDVGIAERIERGIMLIPEDRQSSGIVPPMTVGQNITIASLGRYSQFAILPRNFGARQVMETVRDLGIKITSPAQSITALSGGNQQKVIVGKALLTSPKVLLMDEPGRGIDVNAKTEIFTIMTHLAAAGLGILFVSSEIKEIIALASRTLVMADGRITGEFHRGRYSEHDLVQAAARTRKAPVH
jgi:erythritol transport system ATP-binding protein